MLGEDTIKKVLNNILQVDKAEIKYIRKIFRRLDEALEAKENLEYEEDEKERKHLEWLWGRRDSIWVDLSNLAMFEVTCESFQRYSPDEKYVPFILRAYEEHKDRINAWDRGSNFRLQKKPITSERKATKSLEEFIKGLNKNTPLVARLLLSDYVTADRKKIAYAIRDWLINDFDDLIDKIEPVRQEYIISRKGNVKEEEVEDMLKETFPDEYDMYSSCLLGRPFIPFVYYPNLKIK